jgi:predicted dehydrogenase
VSERPGWGILASGSIAHSFASDLVGEGFTVAAVGSRSIDRARAFAAEFGIPAAHGSYEELVADPSVDIVYVATPHSHHAENALLAISAGKHVLVEKAFTLTQREAQRVADAAAAAGVIVMEAMWSRFLPHMTRVREIVESGALGDVRTVLADHTQSLPLDPEHRLQNPSLGGGALLDLGIYPISFAVDVLGLPAGIQAHAALTETGVDRQTAAILSYADGRQAIVNAALDTTGPTRAAIIGTEGFLELDRTFYAPTSFSHFDARGDLVERFDAPVRQRGMQFQATELEARVGGAHPTTLPIDETVAIMGILDEIRRQIGVRYAADDDSDRGDSGARDESGG